jgi:hypothetical protein
MSEPSTSEASSLEALAARPADECAKLVLPGPRC